jgi:hypothetical protein
MRALWDLPAGHAFAIEARDRLERGDHLTIALPRGVDVPAFEDHLRRCIGMFAHHAVDVSAAGESDPIEFLIADLDVDLEPGRIATVDDLVGSRSASGVVVWLEGVADAPEPARQRWAELVCAASRATRRLGADSLPPRFVAVVHGTLGPLQPSEPGWSALLWWGRTGRLDTALHVQREAPATNPALRSCVVEVAGFDIELAERLAVEGVDELDSLARVLRDERGLREFAEAPATPAGHCLEDEPAILFAPWSRGEVDRFDGDARPFWHACLFADEPGLVTLRRRLWRGQVNQLLPRLEEWRVQLVETAKAEGFIAGGVRIDELDFADLHNHLRRGSQGRRRSELADFAGWLRGARNKIAHLDLLDRATRARGERLAQRCLA